LKSIFDLTLFVLVSTDIHLSVAARKIGSLLTKVAANKHFQRFAALKPVAGVFEKLSNAEIGANIELLNISGMMTVGFQFSFEIKATFHVS